MTEARHRIVRTFHSTAMVRDYDVTVASLRRLAGLMPLEYAALELYGRRGGMTWVGDGSLEIGDPIVAGHSVERFVERFGGGMHNYAFEVTDIDATVAHLAATAINVAVRPSENVVFTDPRTTGGLLFEWADTHIREDPRFGLPSRYHPPCRCSTSTTTRIRRGRGARPGGMG